MPGDCLVPGGEALSLHLPGFTDRRVPAKRRSDWMLWGGERVAKDGLQKNQDASNAGLLRPLTPVDQQTAG